MPVSLPCKTNKHRQYEKDFYHSDRNGLYSAEPDAYLRNCLHNRGHKEENIKMDNSNLLKVGNSTLQDGKYIINRVLGQGGFGITYEAEQVSLGRKVAIKEFFMKEYCERDSSTSRVSVPSSGSRELVERFRLKFLKEARMIASLSHPNIIKIYDVFEENDTAYYVMEYHTNGSLKDKVERTGCLAINESDRYIRQICSALKYIHGQNILHLDVKPSNILLDKDDNVILIDFGISKRFDEVGIQTSSTPVGKSKGFAPLEQYQQGDMSLFSPATDIYSLGATLYYMVTGALPPEASVVNEGGLPPFNANVPENMANTIRQSMQPKRMDRPQSIDDFLFLFNSYNHKTVPDTEKTTVVTNSNIKKAVPGRKRWQTLEEFLIKGKRFLSKWFIVLKTFIIILLILGSVGSLVFTIYLITEGFFSELGGCEPFWFYEVDPEVSWFWANKMSLTQKRFWDLLAIFIFTVSLIVPCLLILLIRRMSWGVMLKRNKDTHIVEMASQNLKRKFWITRNRHGKYSICRFNLLNFKRLLKYEYDDIEHCEGCDDCFILLKEGKQGMYNSHVKKIVAECVYDSIVYDSQKDLYVLMKGNKRRYLTKDGFFRYQ